MIDRSLSRRLLFLLFVWLFLFSYANQLIYHYQVPAGGDALNHETVVQNILRGDYGQIYHYHSAWHLLVAGVVLITHVRAITIMAWLAPLLLVTMASMLYYFNKRYFGPVAGVAALVLIGFFSNQPIQTLYDGGLPNVLAAGTVLPLVVILLDRIWDKPRKLVPILWFLLGLLLLGYSHHLTTLYWLPIMALFLLAMVIRRERARKRSRIFMLVSFILLLAGGILALSWFLGSSVGGSVQALAKQFLAVNWTFPFIHLIGKLDNPNAMWPLSVYPNGIGEALVYLGLGGLAIALYHMFFRSDSPNWRIYTILSLWTILLLIGSQTPSLGFPVRLARDLAIPLALLGGVFIASVMHFIESRRIPHFLTYCFLIVAFGIGWQTLVSRYERVVLPNPLINHLEVDTKAGEYISRTISPSAKIVVFQDDIYLHDFAPHHTIVWSGDHEAATQLVKPASAQAILKDIDYLYIEERTDRDESWINNHGIVEAYLKSPSTRLVAQFAQPEKKVYLFQSLIKTSPPTQP